MMQQQDITGKQITLSKAEAQMIVAWRSIADSQCILTIDFQRGKPQILHFPYDLHTEIQVPSGVDLSPFETTVILHGRKLEWGTLSLAISHGVPVQVLPDTVKTIKLDLD